MGGLYQGIAAIIVNIVLIFGLQYSSTASLTLEIDASRTSLAVGDDVSIQCRVAGMTSDDFVQWQKRWSNGSVDLATNRILTNDYAESSGRYTIRSSSSTDNNGTMIKTYTMAIKGIQLEDAGQIGCLVLETSAFLHIHVLAPPDYISFTIISSKIESLEVASFFHDDEMDFDDITNMTLLCSSYNSFPITSPSIKYNDVVKESAETTSNCLYTGSAMGFSSTICNSTLTYEVGKEFLNFFWLRKLTCDVRPMDLSNVPGSSVTVTRIMKPPPSIACQEYVWFVPYTTRPSISCTVNTSSPFHVEWKWKTLFDERGFVTLRPGEEEGIYKATMHQLQEGSYVMELHFEKAYFQVFRNYELTATNEHGQEKARVFVEESDGFSSAPTIRPRLFIVLLILVYLFWSTL